MADSRGSAKKRPLGNCPDNENRTPIRQKVDELSGEVKSYYEALPLGGGDTNAVDATMLMKQVVGNDDIYSEKVADKEFLIEKFEVRKDFSAQQAKNLAKDFQKNKGMTKKEIKHNALFQFPKESLQYSLYEPMNSVWTQYFADILGPNPKEDHICAKILKADLNGALVCVEKSICESNVGIKGIILQETRKTVRIITKENKLKIVLKQTSVFLIEYKDQLFRIYGENFTYTPSERSRHRFKNRDIIKLL